MLDIVPQKRKNEVLAFLDRGLQDISISRSNERAKNGGVPVPDDPTQRMYVWFDALNIYQSGIGFGWDDDVYKKWWPADLHVIGKGITRFHAVYWPAFLLSAGLKLPKKIFVHEYFTVNGQKMSKTLGNVIDPTMLIEKYGIDPLRYYFLARFSPFSDGDFSERKFKEVYNADLANGLGNLVARVAKLIEMYKPSCGTNKISSFSPEVQVWLDSFQFDQALREIWEKLKGLDRYLELKKPWEKSGLHGQVRWIEIIDGIRQIAYDLQPFLPSTAEKILSQFSVQPIKTQPPLFPRL
ncbi:methionine--tRNA ligase [Candidatus Gottesmanbacteria bacterium]|nr:methionine--tRNA ligase [Candidatus Gottesmanbacteria bacterium]